jgi:hypothetical protein
MGSVREKQQFADYRRYGLEVIFIGRYSEPGYAHTNQVLFMMFKSATGRTDFKSHCFILQVAVSGASGAPTACLRPTSSYIVMKSEMIELVIKESCCCLWNETFKCFAFATEVN